MNRVTFLCAVSVVIICGELRSQPASYPFVNQYRLDFEKALRQGDPSLVLPYYATHIRLMPPFQKTVKGSGNVTAYYRALLKRFTLLKANLKSLKTYTIDTLLVDQGTFEHKLQVKSGTSVRTTECPRRTVSNLLPLAHHGTHCQ